MYFYLEVMVKTIHQGCISRAFSVEKGDFQYCMKMIVPQKNLQGHYFLGKLFNFYSFPSISIYCHALSKFQDAFFFIDVVCRKFQHLNIAIILSIQAVQRCHMFLCSYVFQIIPQLSALKQNPPCSNYRVTQSILNYN